MDTWASTALLFWFKSIVFSLRQVYASSFPPQTMSSSADLGQSPQDQNGIPGEKVVSSDADRQAILQGSRDSVLGAIGLPPNEPQRLISNISSSLDKLVPVERYQLVPIFAIICVETAFFKWIRRSNEDVLSTIFFTLLFGGFAWPAWSHLKCMNYRLDELSKKIEVLEHAVRSSHSIFPPPIVADRHNEATVVQVMAQQEGLAPEPSVPIKNPAVPDVEPPKNTNNTKPYDIPDTPDGHNHHPTVTEDPTLPPSAIPDERGHHVVTEDPTPLPPATPDEHGHHPVVTEDPTPLPPATPNERGHHPAVAEDPTPSPPITGNHPNTAELSHNGFTGDATEKDPSAPVQDHSRFSRWSPALLEMKQQIERFTEGRLQRVSHLDQRDPPNVVSLRRIGVRLLMSCASFSPADFASAIGYLGAPQTTLYYPTGNIQRDRIVAFTTAMDCLDDLEFYIRESDDVKIAGKLPELAQALSDLGLHEYALTTCNFALEVLEGPHAAARDTSRLDLASVLSLQANILCDLKRKDESVEAADKAAALCREYRDSQVDPVPELAYALINYAVLLCSFGLMDEGAALAFELLGEVDNGSRPDMKHISSLCRLCLSITRIEDDNEMALSTAEEAIELSRGSSDADSQAVLACALLTKSKILSSKGQDEAACPVSAEATTVLRTLSVGRSLFSLFLAHALDTHAHHLSEANRKPESFSTLQDALEVWQTLKISAPGPIARPLAWCLFHLAKFRQKGANRDVLKEELRIAETAVTVFREVSPLDAPGLGDALYLYADRMLELDKNRESAEYAEESIHYFREARLEESGKEKYAIDLIFSLSLASSCLACTERAGDAFEYAKQAVEVQHERQDTGGGQYEAHLRKLLMDVIFRSTEMDRQEEALPWMQELNRLGDPENMPVGDGRPLLRRSGNQPQGRNEPEIRKETSYWMDPSSVASESTSGTPFSAQASSSSSVDKGKAREDAASAEAGDSTPRIDKGKGREVNPPSGPSGFGRRQADEEIFSPGAAAAQRRLAGRANAGGGPLSDNMFGPGGDDFFGNLFGGLGGRGMGMGPGMGGRPGSPGMGGPVMDGMDGRFGGGRLGGMGASSPGMDGMDGRFGGGRFGGMGASGGPGMDGMDGRFGGGRFGGMGASGGPGMDGMDGRFGGGRLGGMGGPGSEGRPGGGRFGGMGGMGGLSDGFLSGLGNPGAGAGAFGPGFFSPGGGYGASDEGGEDKSGKNDDGQDTDSTTRTGTWSGMGMQSRLSEEGA